MARTMTAVLLAKPRSEHATMFPPTRGLQQGVTGLWPPGRSSFDHIHAMSGGNGVIRRPRRASITGCPPHYHDSGKPLGTAKPQPTVPCPFSPEFIRMPIGSSNEADARIFGPCPVVFLSSPSSSRADRTPVRQANSRKSIVVKQNCRHSIMGSGGPVPPGPTQPAASMIMSPCWASSPTGTNCNQVGRVSREGAFRRSPLQRVWRTSARTPPHAESFRRI